MQKERESLIHGEGTGGWENIIVTGKLTQNIIVTPEIAKIETKAKAKEKEEKKEIDREREE